MTTAILSRPLSVRNTAPFAPACPASRIASAAEAHRELHAVSAAADFSEVEALLAQVREAMGFDVAADLEEAVNAYAANCINLAATHARKVSSFA